MSAPDEKPWRARWEAKLGRLSKKLLHLIRFLSVAGLCLVFAASTITLVQNAKVVSASKKKIPQVDSCDYFKNSTIPNQTGGMIWAIGANVLTLLEVILLCLSESDIEEILCCFEMVFPILGSESGVGPIGFFQCLIAVQILSQLANELTLVAGIYLFVIGCVNMAAGILWGPEGRTTRSRWLHKEIPAADAADAAVTAPAGQGEAQNMAMLPPPPSLVHYTPGMFHNTEYYPQNLPREQLHGYVPSPSHGNP